MKKLLSTLLVMSLCGAMPTIAQAAIDDLEDLRSSQAAKEWRLLKHDKRLNIKSYDKRDDQNSGVRSFKLDVIANGSL